VSHDQVEAPATSKADHKERNRRIAALVVGVLIVIFAVVNTDKVKVSWVVTSTTTPLIVVIVVAMLFGMAIDRMLVRRARKRSASTGARGPRSA
jgi:uncharacterized integral membrane protein